LTAKMREAKRYVCLLHSLHSIMSLWVTEDHSLICLSTLTVRSGADDASGGG
jgi:hypothetical protein